MLDASVLKSKEVYPSHVKSILETFDNDKEISFINLVPSLNKSQKLKIQSLNTYQIQKK